MLLGLGHRAGVGKDEVAEYLREHYGYYKRAFADALKEAATAIFGLTERQMYTFDGKHEVDPYWGVTPRFILQKMGTECMRDGYAQDIWVRSLFKFIEDDSTANDRWVAPDVRFREEANAIQERGGKIVEIVRPGHMDENLGISGHASEVALDGYDKWDYVLQNDGSLEDLYSKVDEMMESFGVPRVSDA